MDQALRQLAARAWALHSSARRSRGTHLVQPSIPILFFGDSGRYLASSLRVLTVGLNPSREEFPAATPYRRFPGGEELDATKATTYLGILNAYFRVHPYTGWFNPSFEQLLRGLGASYYDTGPSAALHTDLCSPLATDPTWSRLDRQEQADLAPEGHRL